MTESTKLNSVFDVLERASDIYKERNAVYGDAADRHGEILAAMFPDGLTLKTADDFTRFMHINSVIGKINRYANNFESGGHLDSSLDPINALAMLTVKDQKGENK